jgi:hypothetical protein
MSPELVKALNLISEVTAAASALLLYWGSLSAPWSIQSYSGDSEPEQRYRHTRRAMVCIGIPCVVIAAGCQIAVTLAA